LSVCKALSYFSDDPELPVKYRLLPPVLAAIAGFSALTGAARAQSASADAVFSTKQRAAIVQIMRQALQDDPTILTEAIRSLRVKAQQQQEDKSMAGVRAHRDELQQAPDFAVRGNPHGKITVVEFFDPRCSYCRHMMPVVDAFLARHPDVRLVEKLVPVLGEGSVIDTRAIFAASAQGKYDVMRRALMDDTTKPTMDRVSEVAKANGLDMTRFAADMSAPQTVALITTNLDQARAVNLDGTPTFIFGTAAMAPGALEPDQMDEFLERARKA